MSDIPIEGASPSEDTAASSPSETPADSQSIESQLKASTFGGAYTDIVIEDPTVVESSTEEVPAPAPEVTFPVSDTPTVAPKQPQLNLVTIAREVIAGKWTHEQLQASGYNLDEVQTMVGDVLDPSSTDYKNWTLQPGDTLKNIATRVDFKGGWKALHAKNLGIIGLNPEDLTEGTVISL